MLLFITIAMQDEELESVEAVVHDALPNLLFRVVKKGDDQEKSFIAYLAGKLRKFKIKILVGDTVLLKIDEYGGKARIIRRL